MNWFDKIIPFLEQAPAAKEMLDAILEQIWIGLFVCGLIVQKDVRQQGI